MPGKSMRRLFVRSVLLVSLNMVAADDKFSSGANIHPRLEVSEPSLLVREASNPSDAASTHADLANLHENGTSAPSLHLFLPIVLRADVHAGVKSHACHVQMREMRCPVLRPQKKPHLFRLTISPRLW